MNPVLMGLDIGGCSIRCTLFELGRDRSTSAARRWAPVPAPRDGFFAFTIDTARCWRLVAEVVREVLHGSGVTPDDVLCLAVAGTRFSLVLVDDGDRVLFAVPNHDARAAEESIRLADDLGPELCRRAGRRPLPIFTGSRLVWLAGRRPRLLERAACAFSLADWVALRLTGVRSTDLSQAGESLLFDLDPEHEREADRGPGPEGARSESSSGESGRATRRAPGGDWAWDLIDRLGLPRDVFPAVRPSGTPLGAVTAAAAEELGLRRGTMVAVGGADTQCGLLGVGAVEAGQLGIVAGSTAPLQLVTGRPVVECGGRLWAGRHVVPDRWVLESNAGAMGDTLDWLAGVLHPDARSPVARLIAGAGEAAVGAGGVVSSLGAQVMDGTDMLAMPVGSLWLTHLDAVGGRGEDREGDGGERSEAAAAAYPPPDEGRSHDATRAGRLGRAVLEGMAFALKANAAQLVAAAGMQAGRADVRLAGGLARSPFFAQLACDVLETPLSVSETAEASAVGAAICAGLAAAAFADPEEAFRALVHLRRLEPAPRSATLYRELYADWERLRDLRAPADRCAAGIALRDQMERARTRSDAPPRPSPAVGRPLSILATADLDERSLVQLRELGDVTHESYRDALRLLTGDDLVEALRDRDVLITEVDILDAAALARCRDLRVVAACRGDAVNVDVAACTALGIPVLHAPGRNAEAVADLTLAFMLMLARKMPAATAFLHAPGAEAGDMGRMGQAHAELRGRELWEQVVGLIGWGAVGRGVTRRLRAFGARVLVCDPYVPADEVRAAAAEPTGLEDLLAAADIVSLHAPLTEQTRGLLDGRRLGRMKPGAFLVNTARAALVDESALLEELRSGRLAGAALDVFSREPPGADDPLLASPAVIATPHLGGNTVEVGAHQGRALAADLRRLAAGLAPRHVLNPGTLARFSWHGERPAIDAATLAALTAASQPAVSDVHRTAPAATSAEAPAAATRGGPTEGEIAGLAGLTDAGGADRTVPGASADPVVATLDRVLRLFLERAAGDGSLRAFAAGHSVASHYVLSDLGVEFFICFGDGCVDVGMGAPSRPADVRLKARAEVFDAILTGKLGGNRAAMTGKLSFSGDVRLAMGMQRVQKDLIRLYTAAREECGGLDLTPRGGQTAAAAPAGPPATVSAAPAGPPSATLPAAPAGPLPSTPAGGGPSGEAAALRAELAAVAEELFAAGLITATGGNASVRIPSGGDAWITPSQLFKGGLSADMMVRIGPDGEALDAAAPAPSSERHLHCEVYRVRPDVQAVVHAHPVYATILGMCDLPFLPVDTEAAFFGELPRVPFHMPGSRELAAAVAEALGEGPAALLVNHGLVVAGSSLRRAADMAAVIEHVSHLVWGCRVAGHTPATLPPDVVAMLREIGEMMG